MSNKVAKMDKKNRISEIDDHIRNSFDIKKRLGKGAYGIVWKATDRKTQLTVAIKKIFDAFRNETDAQRTFREIMFLRAFRNHPNIVQLYSIHKAVNHMDIYLSFEFMESDLHNVIKRGSILKDIHKRYIMYQLFNATKFIHSGNVIHRDMKPSNVLIDSKCRCKLADFGLARSLSPHYKIYNRNSAFGDIEKPCLTDYVATRWYRAPEILIANKSYTKGIDMWSLGCILGEMVRGKPLFPGSSTVKQVECIVRALPTPNERDLRAVGEGFGTCLLNQINKSEDAMGIFPKLDDLLVDATTDAKHLTKTLLQFNPMKRLTANEAMNHKYVEKFRNTVPELELTADVLPPFRDDIQFTVSEYRSKLYEIMSCADKVKTIKRLEVKNRNSSLSSSPLASSQSNNSSESLLNSNDMKKCYRDVNANVSQSQENLNAKKYSFAKNSGTYAIQNQATKKSFNGDKTTLVSLNCCKNCNQNATQRQQRPESVLMPKLQNSIGLTEGKPTRIRSEARGTNNVVMEMRRNSMDANTFFRKMANNHPIIRNKILEIDYRRKSLDDGAQRVALTSAVNDTKISKRWLSSIVEKGDSSGKCQASSKMQIKCISGVGDQAKNNLRLTVLDSKVGKNKSPDVQRRSDKHFYTFNDTIKSNRFLNEYKYAI